MSIPNTRLLEFLKDKRFILASSSPRRLEILHQMGVENVEIVPSTFEEDLDKTSLTPDKYVLETAIEKGTEVHKSLISRKEKVDVILSADTVVVCNGKIYEKPSRDENHLEMLKTLRDSPGGIHTVMTGIVILVPMCPRLSNSEVDEKCYDYKQVTHIEKTDVYFDTTISDATLKEYVESGEGSNVAGGFMIQKFGGVLISKINGDYQNVVGLPLRPTYKLLEKALLN